jgi:hypothetical protein
MAFRRSIDSLAGEFGRRRFLPRFLMAALGSGVALTNASRLIAATEFWNAKEPSTWTEEEIHVLITKSPWAREVTPSFKHADDPTAPTYGEGARRGGGKPESAPRIYVRWESGQPILDALRAPPLPADLADHYVVSVTNLPIAVVRRGPRGETTPDDSLDRIQNGATLQPKGKDPAEAGIARRTRIGSILFGFSRDYLRLTSDDREIYFTLDTELLTVRARFDAKEMIYHGKLAM